MPVCILYSIIILSNRAALWFSLRGGDIHVNRYVKINLDKTCKVGFNNGIDQTYESIEIKVPETQQKDVERVAKFDIME